MSSYPKEATIIIDSREQIPLLFPATIVIYDPGGTPKLVRLSTVKEALPTGDYALKGHEGSGLVERKGSVAELARNLLPGSSDRRRALTALRRLANACRYPLILLDVHLRDFHPRDVHLTQPRHTLCELIRVLGGLGVPFWMIGGAKSAGSRRMMGGTVATYLLETAYDLPNG